MTKLIAAGFMRLWKDKIFWLAMAIIFVVSADVMFMNGGQAAYYADTGAEYAIDDFFFQIVPMLGFFFAPFISVFCGAEYSDGTIRNKLIIGHKRRDVYISSLVVNTGVTMLFLAAWALGAAVVGFLMLGGFKAAPLQIAAYFLISICSAVSLCAIFTVPGMLCTNKAISVVICFALAFVLVMSASYLNNALSEPEFLGGYTLTAQGVQTAEEMPNPKYLTGMARTVHQALLDIHPVGQGLMLSFGEISRPLLNIVSSIVTAIVTSLCGALFFRKKDLK